MVKQLRFYVRPLNSLNPVQYYAWLSSNRPVSDNAAGDGNFYYVYYTVKSCCVIDDINLTETNNTERWGQ
jgi:hypothetical protein